MKSNGIIYPNTPYFRRFGGKIRIPAGVDEGGKNLYVELVDEFILYVFSKDEINTIEVKIDDTILTSPTDYGIEAVGQIDEDMAAAIKEMFPDLPDIVGWFGYGIAFTDNMFYGVSVGEHTLVITANDESASAIIVTPADPIAFVSAETGFDVSMTHYGANQTTPPNIEYSVDECETWNVWDYSAIHIDEKDVVYFRGNNERIGGNGTSAYSTFVLTPTIEGKKISCNGDVTSLLNGVGRVFELTKSYTFQHLFENCTALLSMPLLISTSLASSCYKAMFKGCTSLSYITDIMATMISESACEEMFVGCTSLKDIIPMNRVTWFGSKACKSMYNGCTSLLDLSVYEIHCNSGANDGHYMMFKGCTSLQKGIKLTIANFFSSGAITEMYSGCTSLNDVYLNTNLTTIPLNAIQNWLQNVSASGVVRCPASLTLTTNSPSGIPSGWTRADIE